MPGNRIPIESPSCKTELVSHVHRCKSFHCVHRIANAPPAFVSRRKANAPAVEPSGVRSLSRSPCRTTHTQRQSGKSLAGKAAEPASGVRSIRQRHRSYSRLHGQERRPRKAAFGSIPSAEIHCWNPERGETATRKSRLTLRPFSKGGSPPAKPVLLDPRAAALDQNDKHDNKQNASNNPNDRDTVHFNCPFLQRQAPFIPQPEPCKGTARRQSIEVSGPEDCGGCRRSSCTFTAPPNVRAVCAT